MRARALRASLRERGSLSLTKPRLTAIRCSVIVHVGGSQASEQSSRRTLFRLLPFSCFQIFDPSCCSLHHELNWPVLPQRQASSPLHFRRWILGGVKRKLLLELRLHASSCFCISGGSRKLLFQVLHTVLSLHRSAGRQQCWKSLLQHTFTDWTLICNAVHFQNSMSVKTCHEPALPSCRQEQSRHQSGLLRRSLGEGSEFAAWLLWLQAG